MPSQTSQSGSVIHLGQYECSSFSMTSEVGAGRLRPPPSACLSEGQVRSVFRADQYAYNPVGRLPFGLTCGVAAAAALGTYLAASAPRPGGRQEERMLCAHRSL